MQKMEDCSVGYTQMEMECERQKSFPRGHSCSRQTVTLVLLVLLGTVCIISLIMTSVNFSHQERKFSMLESWMKSHTSNLTLVKSDFQNTGNALEKKVAELQMLVSSLSLHRNTSGWEAQEQKLSTIETLIKDLGSSLSSLTTKQEENQQKLDDRSSSIMNLKNSMGAIRSSVRALTYKLSFSNLIASGCTEPDWIPFSNSCYLFSQDNMNWTEAKKYCEQQGALLVKIEDGADKEWQFVSRFNNLNSYWVGLTDRDTGVWRWADDTPYTMNKAQWSPGQPDNWTEHGLGEEDEDCGHITIYGLLNDIHCSTKIKYICEMNNPKISS